MKKLIVHTTVPVTAKRTVTGESMPEKPTSENTVKPGPKCYTVVMEATSVKEVPVKAFSPEAAEAQVMEMYNTGDVLDFTDADVICVGLTVVPDENASEGEEAMDDLMASFVRLIRSTDAPDAILGHILNRTVGRGYQISVEFNITFDELQRAITGEYGEETGICAAILPARELPTSA